MLAGISETAAAKRTINSCETFPERTTKASKLVSQSPVVAVGSVSDPVSAGWSLAGAEAKLNKAWNSLPKATPSANALSSPRFGRARADRRK